MKKTARRAPAPSPIWLACVCALGTTAHVAAEDASSTPPVSEPDGAPPAPVVLESYVTPTGRTVFRVPGSAQPVLTSYQTPSGREVLRVPGVASTTLETYRTESGRVIVRAPEAATALPVQAP